MVHFSRSEIIYLYQSYSKLIKFDNKTTGHIILYKRSDIFAQFVTKMVYSTTTTLKHAQLASMHSVGIVL